MFRKVRNTLVAMSLAASMVLGVVPKGIGAFAQQSETENPEPSAQEDTLDIAVMSDIHILPPDLIKDTEDYQNALNSDRKIFTESTGILDRMLTEVKEEKPDVLMISGDLTKDGELEGHQYLAKELEKVKEAVPGIKIYVTNGNHDINNSLGYNYNTEDGIAVPATRTTPELFLETYEDTVYNEANGVVAQFRPSTYTESETGDKAGMLSYVAEPAEGYTIIVVDSGRYSADNTDEGTAEHQTSGQISEELENWVVEQAEAAREKGNTVIGMMHHGLAEHFSMEEEILGEYVVNDYKNVASAFADAGMQFVFTGHMHANDITVATSENGNVLYDIETGSAVTYPCPMRFVSFTSESEGGEKTVSANISTRTNLDNVTYTTADKQQATIENLTEYAKQPQFGLSEDVIANLGTGLVGDLAQTITAGDGLKANLLNLIGELLGIPVSNVQSVVTMLMGLLPQEPGGTVYYDAATNNIIVSVEVLIISGDLGINAAALGQSLEYLLDEADKVLKDNAKVRAAADALIRNVLNMKVYDAPEGEEEDKTLVQLVNDVYQTHLSGADCDEEQIPAYIAEVEKNIENGTLVASLLDTLFNELWKLVLSFADEISLSGFLGTEYVDITKDAEGNEVYTPKGLTGRIPLFDNPPAGSPSGKSLLGTVYGGLGIGGTSDMDKTKIDENTTRLTFKEETTVEDLLTCTALSLAGVDDMIKELLLGKAETEEEAGSEGLIDDSVKGTISELLGKVVSSMTHDVSYTEDNDTTITITETGKTVSEIHLLDFRTEYEVGDEFENGKLLVVYTDGTTETVNIADTMVKGFDTSSEGEKSVTINYKGKSIAETVKVSPVTEAQLNRIEILSYRTQYTVGEAFEEGILLAVYSDGTSKKVAITEDMVEGFTTEKKTSYLKTIVSYGGLSKQVTVKVVNEVSKVIINKDVRTEYEVGEAFSGGTLTVINSDGSVEEDVEITEDMVSGFDSSVAKDRVYVKITYGGAYDTIYVNISEKSPEPEKTIISVAVTDFDLDYTVGDEFSGGKVLVVYSDGTTESVDLTAEMLSGFDTSSAGEKTVTVTYEGKTATVKIQVEEATEPDPEPSTPDDGAEDSSVNSSENSSETGSEGEGCGSSLSDGTVLLAGMLLLAAAVTVIARKKAK